MTVPADTPVTKPNEVTVAIAVFEDTHGLAAAVADPVNCVVALTQTVRVPLIVGNGFKVTVITLLYTTELISTLLASLVETPLL